MHYSLVHPTAVDPMWPLVGPWIVQAIGDEAAYMDVEWIKKQAQQGVCLIWLAHTEENFTLDNIEAVLVCEVAFYCGLRTLIMRWLSGKAESISWTDHIAYLENWAEHNGFVRTEVWGRKGWERVLKPAGYVHESTHLCKFLRRSIN